VTDTGVGLDPADQERVFDDFAQAQSGAAGNQQGTGLGLPVSSA